GSGLGEMNEPVGLAISRDNKLFVAESYNARIQVFSRDGKAIRAWRGTDKGELTCPQGIALDDGGRVYVSDQAGKIVVYDGSGNLLYSFGQQGSGVGQLRSPTSLVVRQGQVFVTDVGNNRIQVFKQTGEPLFAVGKSGEG